MCFSVLFWNSHKRGDGNKGWVNCFHIESWKGLGSVFTVETSDLVVWSLELDLKKVTSFKWLDSPISVFCSSVFQLETGTIFHTCSIIALSQLSRYKNWRLLMGQENRHTISLYALLLAATMTTSNLCFTSKLLLQYLNPPLLLTTVFCVHILYEFVRDQKSFLIGIH